MTSPSLSSRLRSTQPKLLQPTAITTTTSSSPFSRPRTASLKVLSYNVNGIKYLNGDRLRKLRSIATFIAAGHFDLVALQEVFCAVDAQLLAARLRPTLPYSHWFTNSSPVGSPGLMTLSRWPLTAIHQRQFSLQGNPLKIYHGDWFAGKGVGYVRVMVPMDGSGGGGGSGSSSSKGSKNSKNSKNSKKERLSKGPLYKKVLSNASTDTASHLTVHFFNTHLLANYGGETIRGGESQYAVHRLAQAYELAAYVEAIIGGASSSGRPLPADSALLLAGDLNTLLTDPGYDLLLTRLALFDAHLCPNKACSCYKSANRRFPAGLAAGGCPRADKIDYILLRLGGNLSSLVDIYRESGQEAVVVDEKVPITKAGDPQGKGGGGLVATPMSDHLPVVVRVVLSAGGKFFVLVLFVWVLLSCSISISISTHQAAPTAATRPCPLALPWASAPSRPVWR